MIVSRIGQMWKPSSLRVPEQHTDVSIHDQMCQYMISCVNT